MKIDEVEGWALKIWCIVSLPTKMCNCCKKDHCQMKGAYLTENVLYYTRLSCDNKTDTQLYQNEYSESTNEEWIGVIFYKL